MDVVICPPALWMTTLSPAIEARFVVLTSQITLDCCMFENVLCDVWGKWKVVTRKVQKGSHFSAGPGVPLWLAWSLSKLWSEKESLGCYLAAHARPLYPGGCSAGGFVVFLLGCPCGASPRRLHTGSALSASSL